MSPHSNPRPSPGRPSLWSLLGLLVALSCGSRAPQGPPATGAVRLLDRLESARLESPGSGPSSTAAGVEFGASELAGWRPVAWSGMPVDLEATVPGARRDGAALELGAGTAAWLGLVEVDPGTALVFEAWVSGHGLGSLGASARLNAIEFATRPTDEQLSHFQAHMLASHAGKPVQTNSGARGRLWLRTSPTTHCLALLAATTNDGTQPDLRVRFEDLELRPTTRADRLEDLLGPAAGGDLAARVRPTTVAMTERRALVLTAGEQLSLELPGAQPGDVVDLSLGLLPASLDPARLPSGRALSIEAAVVDATGRDQSEGGPLGLELTSSSLTEESWHPLDLTVAPDAHGPLSLELRVRDPAALAMAPLALVAEPRLLPAALSARAPERQTRRPNVIVISLDTLRADRMGLFGGPRPTTPSIDLFSERCLVFDQAWSNGAFTLPSHMSLFTGQVPSLHGVQGAEDRLDAARSPLLAEQLARRGYTTVAFTGGGYVSPEFGFGRGFDSYGTLDPMINTESATLAKDVRSTPSVDLDMFEAADMGLVEDWLEAHQREPFFMFLHTYSAHQFDPSQASLDAVGLGDELRGGLAAHKDAAQLLFDLEAPMDPDKLAVLMGLYDASVRQADTGVERLLEQLAALDLLEDSLIVLVSDHGKELGEHGSVGHGHVLYEELVHVPLMVFIGSRAQLERGEFAPGRSAQPASLVDVVPTILEALDLPPGPALSGRSLLHPLPDREILAEVQNLAVKFALRRGDQKTIWSPLGLDTFIQNTIEEESFDLALDPLELAPLPADHARIEHLRSAFEAVEARARELESGAGTDSALDAGLRARLEALGYVEDMRRAGD